MNKFVFLLIAFVTVVFGACANQAMPLDDTNGREATNCPPGGSTCSGEGAVCGENVCHCGTWVHRSNPVCAQPCTQPPPPASLCETGMACSGEGVVCSNGGNVCHCSRWTPPSLTGLQCPDTGADCSDLTCPYGTHCVQSGSRLECVVTGGSSGGGNAIACSNVTCPSGTHCSEGSGHIACDPDPTSPQVGTHAVTIEILTAEPVDHVWCEGAEVQQGNFAPDTTAGLFLEAWYSFGCDSFDGTYACTVQVPNDRDLRFQCYLKTPVHVTEGDRVRYTCAAPWMLKVGEVFEVSSSFTLVQNLDPTNPARNCQVD